MKIFENKNKPVKRKRAKKRSAAAKEESGKAKLKKLHPMAYPLLSTHSSSPRYDSSTKFSDASR